MSQGYYRPGQQPEFLPSGPVTVYQAPAAPTAASASEGSGADRQRVKAGRLLNPSFTVPQGAVIQAVLETALDSTQPGPARAIVSRDVRSFDGARVLIPRGSRLYGEYRADLSPGQNRAMIQWTRLVRPDGVTIALDSPSADPLGRAGVKGKVDTHFFTRFSNAFLQTVLNVGASAATRDLAGGTVIVGLPGSTQSVTAPSTDQVKPTLRVSQGTPVSVFVARDLDFTDVER
ncbi:MAG: TrbI/VirB10 family protein [Novosphingobium sp.]|uniref:TrbI/VirB10 family protein n=1 Tax=Novosphingobium sp. TaxID=1874826 RepID=UPI0032BB97C8